jgi:hypothetical protein
MNRTPKKLLLAILASSAGAAMAMACGAAAPGAPTNTNGGAAGGGAAVLVEDVTATIEMTSTGVTYHVALTTRETTGRSGLTISSIRVVLASPTRNGGATFDSSDATTLPAKLTPGGSLVFRFGVTSTVANDLYTQVSFVVGYTDDRGVSGSFTSGMNSFAPPPASNPAPPAGSKFDGIYDFRIEQPTGAGITTVNVAQYFRVVNGRISSPDGVLSGTVDTFGAAKFTSLCPFGAKDPATYSGNLNAGAGPTGNFGMGKYHCEQTPDYNWFVNNGK